VAHGDDLGESGTTGIRGPGDRGHRGRDPGHRQPGRLLQLLTIESNLLAIVVLLANVEVGLTPHKILPEARILPEKTYHGVLAHQGNHG